MSPKKLKNVVLPAAGQLKQIIDEVIKVQTYTKLDFNLEKSRVKEMYVFTEWKEAAGIEERNSRIVH